MSDHTRPGRRFWIAVLTLIAVVWAVLVFAHLGARSAADADIGSAFLALVVMAVGLPWSLIPLVGDLEIDTIRTVGFLGVCASANVVIGGLLMRRWRRQARRG